jgi:hypothetical protein
MTGVRNTAHVAIPLITCLLGCGAGGNEGVGHGAATIIASKIQLTPFYIVSDEQSLYWVTNVDRGSSVWSMPVRGGAIRTVVSETIGGGFLAVDDAYVYYLNSLNNVGSELYRAPKDGLGSPTLVSNATLHGYSVRGATVLKLDSTVYWAEVADFNSSSDPQYAIAVKRAPFQKPDIFTVAEFNQRLQPNTMTICVTRCWVFLTEPGQRLSTFAIESGVPDGGMPAPVAGVTEGCQLLLSLPDAVLCNSGTSLKRVADDGTTTELGMVASDGYGGGTVAYDGEYVYWIDTVTAGTIMSVPNKGGTVSVIARDTNPTAIAVDTNAIYWSDQGGNIMRLDK